MKWICTIVKYNIYHDILQRQKNTARKLDELEMFCNVEDRILEEVQGDIKAQRFTAEKIPTEIY